MSDKKKQRTTGKIIVMVVAKNPHGVLEQSNFDDDDGTLCRYSSIQDAVAAIKDKGTDGITYQPVRLLGKQLTVETKTEKRLV